MGRVLLLKCEHVSLSFMYECVFMRQSIVCVFTDECQEVVVGTFCRPAFVSFYPNAARGVEMIARLCGTIPRLHI